MALQGTLETFSVPEVLRLLSGTKKTGLLALEGDRGGGRVWLADGRISSARSDHEQGDKLEAVLFDLLRYDSGSFVFESDARPDDDDDADHDADVESVLAEAERLLDEWRAIESVVPSLDVHVRLVDELGDDSVTVTAEQWKTLAVIGGGITARRLGAHLDLGEFDACSLARDLVDAGLVQVTEAAPEPAVEPAPAAEVAPTFDHDLSNEEVATLGENLAGFMAGAADEERSEQGAHELAEDGEEVATIDLEAVEAVEPVDALDVVDEPVDEAFDAGDPVDEPVPQPADADAGADADSTPDADDFLSQLSSLSPKAAAAIEATAEDDGDEEAVEAAEADAPATVTSADVGDGDEEINRNLLLKFLSSAKN